MKPVIRPILFAVLFLLGSFHQYSMAQAPNVNFCLCFDLPLNDREPFSEEKDLIISRSFSSTITIETLFQKKSNFSAGFHFLTFSESTSSTNNGIPNTFKFDLYKLSVGPSMEWSRSIFESKQWRWIWKGQASGGFTYQKTQNDNFTSRKIYWDNWRLTIQPGVLFFVNEKFALQGVLGEFIYQYNNGNSRTREGHFLHVSYGLGSLRLGARFFIYNDDK